MHVGQTPIDEVSFRVFDVEATGLNQIEDDIIEIGVYEVRAGKLTQRLNTVIRPRFPVSDRILQLTGLTSDVIAAAPSLEATFPAIVDALSGHCLVAHNAHADIGYLTQALWRCDPHWTLPPAACTLKLSRELMPEVPGHSLAALAEQLHLSLPEHRAAKDALATAELLLILLDKVRQRGAATLDDVIAMTQRKKQPRPEPKISPLTVLALPTCAGIYRFFGPGDRLLYVGYSADLQRRVREHLFVAHSGQSLTIAERALRVETTVHVSPLDAFIAEGEAIESENPLLNVRNAEHGRLRYFRLTPSGGVTLVPYTPELGVGPVVLKRSERDVLRVVRTAFGLSARGERNMSSHPGVSTFVAFCHGEAVDTLPLTDAEWQLLLDIRRACRQAESARMDERAPFRHPTLVRHRAAPDIAYALALGKTTLRLPAGVPIDTWPDSQEQLDALGKRVAAFVRAHPNDVQLSAIDAYVSDVNEARVHDVA